MPWSAFKSRSGPKDGNLVYTFEGSLLGDDKKWTPGATMDIGVPEHPKDADVIAGEKPRHADPDRFDWTVSRTAVDGGANTKIQAVAKMTLYTIKKPLIDKDKKYVTAELDNKKFWGSSA